MFNREALESESFEEQYLDFEKLTQRFLKLQPQDALEAWGHIPIGANLSIANGSRLGLQMGACNLLTCWKRNGNFSLNFYQTIGANKRVRLAHSAGLVALPTRIACCD